MSLSIVEAAPSAPSIAIWIHMSFLNCLRECSWLACTSSCPSTIATSSSSRSSSRPEKT